MEYKDALKAQMEQYYKITAEYRKATVDAMKDARRPGFFKKRDYSGHIRRFQILAEMLRNLDYKSIEIPEEDKAGRDYLALMDRSIDAFRMLCEENVRFYDMTDKKQYRKNGITVKEYAEVTASLQTAIAKAVEETGYLEQAYREYFAADFADQ